VQIVRMIRGTLATLFLPLLLPAQPTPTGAAATHWEPTLYAGVWSLGSAKRGLNEPLLGPMVGVDMRRVNPERRVSLVASLKGYTKGRGESIVDAIPPSRTYRTQESMMVLGLGADWVLHRTSIEWTAGVGGAVAVSRRNTSEVTTTGRPFNPDGDGSRWSHPTGVLSARTGVTLPIRPRLGLRLGAEAFQGVETLTERGPMFAAHVGIVMRRRP